MIRNTHTFNDIILIIFFTSFNKTLFSTLHFGFSAATDAHLIAENISKAEQTNKTFSIKFSRFSHRQIEEKIRWFDEKFAAVFGWGVSLKFITSSVKICVLWRISWWLGILGPWAYEKPQEIFFDLRNSSDFVRNFWTEKSGQVGDPKSEWIWPWKWIVVSHVSVMMTECFKSTWHSKSTHFVWILQNVFA